MWGLSAFRWMGGSVTDTAYESLGVSVWWSGAPVDLSRRLFASEGDSLLWRFRGGMVSAGDSPFNVFSGPLPGQAMDRVALSVGDSPVWRFQGCQASGGDSPRWQASFAGSCGGAAGAQDTVTVLGVPASRRVVLFDATTNLAVREQWSGADGAVVFAGLPAGKAWFAVAFDHTGIYPPVSMSYST